MWSLPSLCKGYRPGAQEPLEHESTSLLPVDISLPLDLMQTQMLSSLLTLNPSPFATLPEGHNITVGEVAVDEIESRAGQETARSSQTEAWETEEPKRPIVSIWKVVVSVTSLLIILSFVLRLSSSPSGFQAQYQDVNNQQAIVESDAAPFRVAPPRYDCRSKAAEWSPEQWGWCCENSTAPEMRTPVRRSWCCNEYHLACPAAAASLTLAPPVASPSWPPTAQVAGAVAAPAKVPLPVTATTTRPAPSLRGTSSASAAEVLASRTTRPSAAQASTSRPLITSTRAPLHMSASRAKWCRMGYNALGGGQSLDWLSWCCQNYGLGCNSSTAAPYDCQSPQADWSVSQQKWCCMHAGVACIATTPQLQFRLKL